MLYLMCLPYICGNGSELGGRGGEEVGPMMETIKEQCLAYVYRARSVLTVYLRLTGRCRREEGMKVDTKMLCTCGYECVYHICAAKEAKKGEGVERRWASWRTSGSTAAGVRSKPEVENGTWT